MVIFPIDLYSEQNRVYLLIVKKNIKVILLPFILKKLFNSEIGLKHDITDTAINQLFLQHFTIIRKIIFERLYSVF